MPAIQCPGCQAHISVNGLVNCPRCQTFLNPPHLRAAATAAAHASITRTKVAGAFPILALAAIGAAGAFLVYAVAFPSAEKTKHRQVMAALLQCQNAIQRTALFGNSEAPPYTPNHGTGDEFYFAWPTGSFSFGNALGGQIKMSASCTGVISTGKIGHLTVNGKDIE